MATRKTNPSNSSCVLKVKRCSANAVLPEKKTEGAAGLDLVVAENYRIYPTTTGLAARATKIKTGIAVEIPAGYHGKIFLRSSTGAKTKLRLANGTGIIDADYRGEILLLIENVGFLPEQITAGDRIAQLIIEKNVDVQVQEVTELAPTERGIGGFGSTNAKGAE